MLREEDGLGGGSAYVLRIGPGRTVTVNGGSGRAGLEVLLAHVANNLFNIERALVGGRGVPAQTEKSDV